MRHFPLRCIARRGKSPAIPARRYLVHIVALFFLVAVIWAEFGNSGNIQVHAITFEHTSPTVDTGCQKLTFSSDGNPFPLCPGPFPGGGNCVWWAWEQWHLLGYNLPLNWGNAADWIVDAERFGLPLGTKPRLGSIAVFPVADGVWAFGTAGHVAFVTGVSQDQSAFNVTYQNYGDPTPMFVGTGYPVSVINEARYQRGQMRFIYFPGTIDPARFSRLPGVNGNVSVAAQVAQANTQINTDINAGTTSRVSLGLPPGSYDQQFNADFTGSGLTDLLLYNRQKGSLDVLTFSNHFNRILPHSAHVTNANQNANQSTYSTTLPQRVSLGDSVTHVNGWGSSLDIQIGDFTGSGRSEILLYDRVSGKIQLLSLTPQLTIEKHVTLPGWGAGWEVYAGQFDGQHSDLFLYNRVIVSNPTFQPTPTTTPTTSEPVTVPTTSPSPTTTPKPSPTPTKTPDPTPTPTKTPSPTPTPSPSPTTTPTPSPTASPSPTETPSSSPTPKPSPTDTSSTGAMTLNSVHIPLDTPQKPGPGGDLSGTSVDPQGQPSNVMLVSFKSDFSINARQEYTLMNDSWEVYIGRFDSANQDGLFLYDRTASEARILDFTSKLQVNHYQVLLDLTGNWDIHTGDFDGSGRAQVLLYDPGTGNAQFLAFDSDLSLALQVDAPGMLPGQVVYVGHFGLPSLSVMLFDPVAQQSTFYAFNKALFITNQYTVKSWTQHWQVLIGSFLDRSTCLVNHTCATGDDVLALNRQTGQVQQFIFTFGNQYHVFDNRSQAFLRDGAAPAMNTVDSSSFMPQTILNTGILNDELY